MNKLGDAGAVSYMPDSGARGNIHVNPRRSTGFYAYLWRLYLLLEKSAPISRGQ